MSDHSNDFMRFSTATSNAAKRLSELGDPQSDDRLTTSLVQGLQAKGFKMLRTVAENDTESSFNELVAKIQNSILAKKYRKAENLRQC